MLKTARLTLAAASLSLLTFASFAQVTVQDPWVRATVANQKATGLFVRLTAAKDARLVSVSSPAAGVAEVHEMAMEGSVMRMRALDHGLELPAGKTVELKPGSYHVMLMDLKQPIAAGDTVPVTLTIEGKDGKKETVEIKAPARALNAARTPPMHDGNHMNMH